MLSPFHLAIPVHNLPLAEEFYGKILGCDRGRSSEHWIDWDFWGHQLVTHLTDEASTSIHNPVDGKSVPVPHFGLILPWEQWQQLADSLQAQKLQFIIEPYVRFKGETGEQGTMFLQDFSGNALEFKSFKDMSQIFAH